MYSPLDEGSGRLAAYQYLEELICGRRVLEVGCGDGLGLARLLALGASEVVGLAQDIDAARAVLGPDRDRLRIRQWHPPSLPFSSDSFDLVLISEAWVPKDHPSLIEEVSRVLARGGSLVLRGPSGDHPLVEDGITYGELLDLVEPHFEQVRVVGQCPFVGYSLVELTDTTDELDVQLDGGLLEGDVEEVVAYLAICGLPAHRELPYGVVQVPTLLLDETSAAPEDAEPEEQAPQDAEPEEQAPQDAEPEEQAPQEQAPQDAEPEEQAPQELRVYTDLAGGRVARWRWPGGQTTAS